MKKDFLVIEPLGSGGAGNVFKVKDPETGFYFALKRFRQSPLTPDHLKKIEKEIRIMSELRHPNVLWVIDWSLDPVDCWYLLPLADSDLETALRNRAFGAAESLSLFRQIAEGLGFLHEKGVVHRDLGTENILLLGETPLLSDFGLARFTADSSGGPVPTTGAKPGFHPGTGPSRSDFSERQKDIELFGRLGVRLFLGNRFPDGDGAVLRLLPKRDSGLAGVLFRCVTPNPTDRFPEMKGVQEALANLSEGDVTDFLDWVERERTR